MTVPCCCDSLRPLTMAHLLLGSLQLAQDGARAAVLRCDIRLAAVRARGGLRHVGISRRPRHVVSESHSQARTATHASRRRLDLLNSSADCLQAPHYTAGPPLLLAACGPRSLTFHCSERI